MIQFRFISALILLVISLLLTSGTGATVASLLQEGKAPACCDADTDKSNLPLDAPCSEPDCQCLSCFAFVMPLDPYKSANNGFHAVSSYNLLVKTPPLEYFKAIDYPPERS